MILVMNYEDKIDLKHFTQRVLNNNGTVEERAIFEFPLITYTEDNIELLKKYLLKDKNTSYFFQIYENSVDEEPTYEFNVPGFLSIEFIAPESSAEGRARFVGSMNQLLYK